MFDAIVLGGGGSDSLSEQAGVSNKGLIMLEGKPLIAYVLEALQMAPSVRKVIVGGPPVELEALSNSGYKFKVVPEKETMLENLAACCQWVDPEAPCLVLTGDIPLLVPEAIEDFLADCAPHDKDFYYPLLCRETIYRRFPAAERTYVRLAEGHITGGNLALLKPGWFLACREKLGLFVSYRKKPLKLLRLIPPTLVIKYLLRRLSVADLEQCLSRMLEFKARAVFCNHAEIGMDVDKPSDLALIRSVISSSPA